MAMALRVVFTSGCFSVHTSLYFPNNNACFVLFFSGPESADDSEELEKVRQVPVLYLTNAAVVCCQIKCVTFNPVCSSAAQWTTSHLSYGWHLLPS